MCACNVVADGHAEMVCCSWGGAEGLRSGIGYLSSPLRPFPSSADLLTKLQQKKGSVRMLASHVKNDLCETQGSNLRLPDNTNDGIESSFFL